MPYKEREIKKKYFTIGEVAKNLKLSTSQIRFWETEFKELNPKKNSKGLRKFTEKDINILRAIQSLLKKKKFTIDGAKKNIKKEINFNYNDIIEKLNSLKEKLLYLKKKI
ncbi:MAG: MerR family transcriptional regulator [Flammeovirgaceae bacterium TMED290]|nr:MAG: MerR family transcriptional regulator [Flammeovirgaceae bacterium TMED290]|tara:strand:- start:2223 stop:2552 length:330 start_codon:yes stop_codon:yes gene_type:complete